MTDGAPLDTAEIARAVVTASLGPRADVASVEALSTGARTVLLLTPTGTARRLLLKIHAWDDAAVAVERTASVTRLAAAAGAPVPEVLRADSSRRTIPWPFVLSEYAAGTAFLHVRPRLDADELRRAHRQLATALLAVQSVRFAGFGELDATCGPDGSGVVEALRRRAQLRIRRTHDRQLFLHVLEKRAELFTEQQPAVLTHDDLHHLNVLFRDDGHRWRLVALLDWDKAWSGPAESDVARMAFWDDMTGPGFWEIYRAAVPPAAGVEERALVHQFLWCLEYDVSTARHTRDTAGVLHRLGIG